MVEDDDRFREKVRAIAARIKPPMRDPMPAICDNDDLQAPAFLRRDGERMSAEQVAKLTNPERRAWIMPDMSKYRGEDEMAKADFLIENRDAQVVVYRYDGVKSEKFHEFKNTDEFERWYKPGKMRFIGQNTQDTFTDVMLEFDNKYASIVTVDNTRANHFKVKLPKGVKPGEVVAGETVKVAISKPQRQQRDTRGRYVDKRHVAKIVAAGFKQTSNDPITFVKGKTTVVIAPPPEGKAWSSDWTINGKQSGRGVTTLLAAVEGK